MTQQFAVYYKLLCRVSITEKVFLDDYYYKIVCDVPIETEKQVVFRGGNVS